MAEPFKNMFREQTVRELAERLAAAGPLKVDAFVAESLEGFDRLELKDRVRQISKVLRAHLDPDYRSALAQILKALPPPLEQDRVVTSGFVIWPLCQFVEEFGVEDPEASLPALYQLTRRFSAEFAIRPFLERFPERTFKTLMEWTRDRDQHVRRLVSEGSRPRLPWGQRLQALVEDPAPILPLLEALKNDPEEYVRRSVANNLNDIAKDHPDLVVATCKDWLVDANNDRVRLVRHALRSLIKQGYPPALKLLGYGPPKVELIHFSGPAKTAIGQSATLELKIQGLGHRRQKLVIDYAFHFPGAGGRTNRKVFKWCSPTLAPGAVFEARHQHSFRPVSTRRTRPGEHRFELLINGRSFGEHKLELS